MHVGRITNALDAELQALLDLHAAKTVKDFWRSARRVLHSALPGATLWFAPAQDWMPPSATIYGKLGRVGRGRLISLFQER